MSVEWDRMLDEFYARKLAGATVESTHGAVVSDSAAGTDDLAAASPTSRAVILTRVYNWLVSDVLPASTNSVYVLSVEEGITHSPACVRVRFAIQAPLRDGQSDDSTLTFSVSDELLISVPDLSPCFRDASHHDGLLPLEAELPDLVPSTSVDREWVTRAVQQFVRAALERQ